MKPQEAYDLLREAIPRRPELRYKTWSPKNAEGLKSIPCGPYTGGCYIGTQVFCHLVPEAKPYHKDRMHFWAQIGDEIWDTTFDQFDFEFPYSEGKRTKFPRITKRAKELLKEVKLIQTSNTSLTR